MGYPHPSAQSPEIKFFLDVLNQRAAMPAEGIDCEKLIEFARFHDLSTLFYYRIQNSDPDLCRKISPRLRPNYMARILLNLRLWNAFLSINTAFIKNKIAMLPLKGLDILARFYPDFDLRSMCDIDIVIKEEQMAEAERVLLALGYQKELYNLTEEYWRKHQCHIVFYKDGIVVEVHWALDFKRWQRNLLPGIWDRARQVEPGGHGIKIFSPEDAIFSFALHLRRFGNVLALKQVLDSARIIDQTPDFDWDYVLKESRRGQMQATVYFLLTQVQLFTGTSAPKNVLKRLSVSFWQKRSIRTFLLKRTFLTTASLKTNYLKAHFLLYDNAWEAILYLINIPHEQFCKYYGLRPYTTRAIRLYNLRLFYMPLRHVLGRAGDRSKDLSRQPPGDRQ